MSLPTRLACRRRLTHFLSFVAGNGNIAMGPCRKHVLLQEAVSEGVWRGKRGAYRLIRLRSVVRFLAANGSWEECAEDGLHSGLATRCAGGANMAKLGGDEGKQLAYERYRDRGVGVRCD